jgi:hypothetical protein
VIGLIELNPGSVSATDIAYICQTLISMAYTPEEAKKYRTQVEWLNSELDNLGLSRLRYPLA